MTIVTAQMSVSADGYYAGPEHADQQTWLEGTEAAGFFRVTRWAIDAEAWRQRLGFRGASRTPTPTSSSKPAQSPARLRSPRQDRPRGSRSGNVTTSRTPGPLHGQSAPRPRVRHQGAAGCRRLDAGLLR
jgi:hypothetical protein